MACGPFGVLGTTVGVQGAGGISWKTGGRAMPMARQIGSMVGPGAVRSRARRPSCSTSISLRSARSSTMRCHSSPAAVDRETVDQLLAQDEGEEGAEDVAADASVGLVKDRAGGEQRLCGFEGILHGQQIAVAQYNLESGDFGVGAQHEEAIESGIGLDLGAIDDEAVAFGRLQETTEALVGDERLVALGELALETGDEFGARRGIFFGFLRVATDDIAPPGDRRLADRQFGFAFLTGDEERHGEAVILDDLRTHLGAGALAHAEDVLDLLGFEGGDGVGADHATIGDNAGLADPEALAQPLDHW